MRLRNVPVPAVIVLLALASMGHTSKVKYNRNLYRHWIDAARDCQDARVTQALPTVTRCWPRVASALTRCRGAMAPDALVEDQTTMMIDLMSASNVDG
jgi:hypothetical protein